jgi:hypothetical protein
MILDARGGSMFSRTLFPIYVAAFLWGGLGLRDRRVRALLSASPKCGTCSGLTEDSSTRSGPPKKNDAKSTTYPCI